MTHPGTEVTNFIFPNDVLKWVSWKYSEDKVAAGKNVNVAVPYITKYARLKLYEYVREWSLSSTAIDSVIYIQKVHATKKFKTVYYLDYVRDELERCSGFFIEEFVSNGPKNYAFFVFCPPLENVNLNVK